MSSVSDIKLISTDFFFHKNLFTQRAKGHDKKTLQISTIKRKNILITSRVQTVDKLIRYKLLEAKIKYKVNKKTSQ